MASINALRLPLKKFFCPQDWHLTHTQYSLTQPQLPRVQSQHLPSTSISFPELIFTSITCIKSHGTHLHMAVLQPSSIFKFNFGAAFGVIAAIFIIGSTFDSIDQTLTATTATHAIRHCNTSSTRDVCDWCDLVIFLV
jgi:hypothetical protein